MVHATLPIGRAVVPLTVPPTRLMTRYSSGTCPWYVGLTCPSGTSLDTPISGTSRCLLDTPIWYMHQVHPVIPASGISHPISNSTDASFNNSRPLEFSGEAWVIATILRAGVLILRSCMNSNRWHFTHSVKFLAAVFLRAGLTYRNTQSLDRMDGRAKRIQLNAALNFAAQIDDENTDKLPSAPSKERFLFFFKI
jgi:hypothetical protein